MYVCKKIINSVKKTLFSTFAVRAIKSTLHLTMKQKQTQLVMKQITRFLFRTCSRAFGTYHCTGIISIHCKTQSFDRSQASHHACQEGILLESVKPEVLKISILFFAYFSQLDSFFDVEFAICALQVLIGALGSTTSDVQVTTTQTTGCHTS